MTKRWLVRYCVFCGRSILTWIPKRRYCSQSCKDREDAAVRMLERTTPQEAA